VDVLATDPDAKNEPLFDPDRRFDDPPDILTLCSSFVTITDLEQTDDYPEYFKDDQGKFRELTLAHFSVREYLVSESLRTHWKLSFYHCDTKLANTFIAKTCVAYLLQFTQPSISRDIRISYPLCSYAAAYWIRHTQPDNDDDRILRRLIMGLLQSESPVYLNWLELYNPNGYLEKCAPIYYMSQAGLAVSRDLLENGVNIHVEGGEYSNALQVASSGGHHDIVQLLLEKGADINVQGGRYGNALQAASFRGHHVIVWLLLEKAADVNAQGGWYGNALQAASFRGHHDIVQLLLEKGADINVQGGRYGNALQAASLRGSS
jgi:Ankyrin repeats (3 copies)/Ankyrin repeat